MPLGWKGIWLPFCWPLTLSAPAERWPKPRFLCLGSGVPGPPSRYWGPSLFRAGWRWAGLPGGIPLEGRTLLGCVDPGASKKCHHVRWKLGASA